MRPGGHRRQVAFCPLARLYFADLLPGIKETRQTGNGLIPGFQIAVAIAAVSAIFIAVNATIFDRYLPFSCPLDAFFTDAVRFPPFHRH